MRKNHSKIVCIRLVHLPYLWTDNVLWLLEKIREQGLESLAQIRVQGGDW